MDRKMMPFASRLVGGTSKTLSEAVLVLETLDEELRQANKKVYKSTGPEGVMMIANLSEARSEVKKELAELQKLNHEPRADDRRGT